MLKRFNETIAVLATRCYGTMWMFYAFALFGLLPVVPQLSHYQDTILYWSNFAQLISLPLLAVGTGVMGQNSETRAKEDHERLLIILVDMQRMLEEMEGLGCYHPAATVQKQIEGCG